MAARHGDDARALRFLSKASEGAVAEHAWSLEAELRRRRGEYREAVEALLRAVARSTEPAPLHLRLAKLYEHRLREFDLAKQHAALCGPAEEAPSHARRHARLNAR